MASPKMERDWKRVKERIRAMWNDTEFSDQELKEGRRTLSKMVNIIREKTGESRTLVSDKIMVIIGCPDLVGAAPSIDRNKRRY